VVAIVPFHVPERRRFVPATQGPYAGSSRVRQLLRGRPHLTELPGVSRRMEALGGTVRQGISWFRRRAGRGHTNSAHCGSICRVAEDCPFGTSCSKQLNQVRKAQLHSRAPESLAIEGPESDHRRAALVPGSVAVVSPGSGPWDTDRRLPAKPAGSLSCRNLDQRGARNARAGWIPIAFERIPSLARRRHPSPMLGKGPGFDLEAPSAAILAGELEGYFRYRRRLDEIAVGLFRHGLARSG
jgi:hypothetical protein